MLLQKHQSLYLSLPLLFVKISFFDQYFMRLQDMKRQVDLQDYLQVEIFGHQSQIFLEVPQFLPGIHVNFEGLRVLQIQRGLFLQIFNYILKAVEQSHKLEFVQLPFLEYFMWFQLIKLGEGLFYSPICRLEELYSFEIVLFGATNICCHLFIQSFDCLCHFMVFQVSSFQFFNSLFYFRERLNQIVFEFVTILRCQSLFRVKVRIDACEFSQSSQENWQSFLLFLNQLYSLRFLVLFVYIQYWYKLNFLCLFYYCLCWTFVIKIDLWMYWTISYLTQTTICLYFDCWMVRAESYHRIGIRMLNYS